MIKLKNVTKYYKVKGNKKYVLKDVSLEIPTNKNIAILGTNGAGKSTFLRMLGGIEAPTRGRIECDKEISWPMGLGGGFQGSMTGENNIKFVCRVYGKNEQEMRDIVSFVKEFSELGDSLYAPIKTYSSGMKSRLAFALSLSFDFDYLLIDEILSVGDVSFRKKSKEALLKKIEKCNVILISHDMNTLKEICDVSIYLNDGEIHYFDNVQDSIDLYTKQ